MFRFGAKWVAVVGIVVATSVVLGAAANNGNGGNPKQPDVVAATVSVDQSTLFVYGENLSSSSLVTFGGIALGGVQADSAGRQLIALMPAVPPGSYRLVITNSNKSCEFYVSVDAAGGSAATEGVRDQPDRPDLRREWHERR